MRVCFIINVLLINGELCKYMYTGTPVIKAMIQVLRIIYSYTIKLTVQSLV